MKPNQLKRKLTLNKETVTRLETAELNKAQGGGWTAWPNETCGLITCERTFCNNCTMPMPCYHP